MNYSYQFIHPDGQKNSHIRASLPLCHLSCSISFSIFLAIFLSDGSYRTATWKKKTIIHKIYWQNAGAQIAFTFVVPKDWVLALCSRVQERMEECSKWKSNYWLLVGYNSEREPTAAIFQVKFKKLSGY